MSPLEEPDLWQRARSGSGSGPHLTAAAGLWALLMREPTGTALLHPRVPPLPRILPVFPKVSCWARWKGLSGLSEIGAIPDLMR